MRARGKSPGSFRRESAVRLDDAYVRAVENLEALPQNRSGADKSWVERAVGRRREHYARALRVR